LALTPAIVVIRGFPPSPHGEFGFFRRVKSDDVFPFRFTPQTGSRSNSSAISKTYSMRREGSRMGAGEDPD